MSEISSHELAAAIVRDAVHRYIESRRVRIDAFVGRHFSLAGSAALHRRALGWDLLRAPANLFLAGPALAVKLTALAARRLGMARPAAWLAGRRLLLETEVAREIEWLVATEFLEIPCLRRGRGSFRDALAETIRRRPRLSPPSRCRGRDLSRIARRDGRDRDRLCRRRSRRRRPQAGDARSGDPELGGGGNDRAADRDCRVSAWRRSRRVVVQPVPGCRRPRTARCPTTAGVFLGGAMLAAFSGVVTDPLQRRLGLHRRRLERLLQILEADLAGKPGRNPILRDHYVARLVDLFDLIALAMRVSHA